MGEIKNGKLYIDGIAMTGAEEMRLCVSNMNHTMEGFNDRYTAAQLIQINRMLVASEWEVFPDQWTKRQVKEALAGKPPQWRVVGGRLVAKYGEK